MLTEAEMQQYRSALYGVAAAVGHAPRMSLAGEHPPAEESTPDLWPHSHVVRYMPGPGLIHLSTAKRSVQIRSGKEGLQQAHSAL